MNTQAEPTTAQEWVIEAAIKINGWDRDDIYCNGLSCYRSEVIEGFSPLTNDSDAWVVMAELIKAKGFQLWYALEIPNVSTARKASFLSYQDLPACLRADGIDPLKALLVYAAVRWL